MSHEFSYLEEINCKVISLNNCGAFYLKVIVGVLCILFHLLIDFVVVYFEMKFNTRDLIMFNVCLFFSSVECETGCSGALKWFSICPKLVG